MPSEHADAEIPQFLYDRGFAGLLSAAASVLRDDITKLLGAVGLPAWGPGRVGLMSKLLDEAMSQVEIAKFLHISPPSAMELVKKLQREGYLKRSRDPKDGRRMVVSLTPLGREKIIAMRRILVAGMEHVEDQLAKDGFTAEDMERCKAVLRAYARADRSEFRQQYGAADDEHGRKAIG